MTLLAKSADEQGREETLLDHTVSVILAARALLQRMVLPEDVLATLTIDIEFAAAVHDIGKAATGFQRWLRGQAINWRGRRHEILSAAFASALPCATEELIFAVLTHHRQIPSDHPNSLKLTDEQLPSDWPMMIKEWEDNIQAVNALWLSIAAELGRTELQHKITLARTIRLERGWLDRSPTVGQAKRIPFTSRLRASQLRGILVTADHLASGRATLPPIVHAREYVSGNTARGYQKRAAAAEGDVILRAPTGSGKTDAAMLWAAKNQNPCGRIFYVLPNTAAINAMFERMRRSFPRKAESVGVLHGRAAHHLYGRMLDDYPSDRIAAQREAVSRARLAREMYYPVRICTPHQLLRYSLRGRGWELMLLEAPGACVIFDEIHSYDAELAGLTIGTAAVLKKLGARVLFMSATLPRFLEHELTSAFPEARVIRPCQANSDDALIMSRLRTCPTVRPGKIDSAIEAIRARLSNNESVLVVCNHVSSAQSMFRQLRDFGGESMLLHGRYHANDRRKKEILLQNEPPQLLVATQAVEVSLDIDYDCGFFEPAPIDALAQRIGRVNRKGSRPPAEVIVFEEALNSHRLYDGDATAETLHHLRSVTGALTEEDVTTICDAVYRDGYTTEKRRVFLERRDHPYMKDLEATLVAGIHEEWTEAVIDKTDGRAEVLPRSLLRQYEELRREKLYLEADGLLVTTYTRNMKLQRYDDIWVSNAPYTDVGLE